MSDSYSEELRDRIRQSVASFIADLGYELVDLKLFRASRVLTLKFLIDRPRGGITIAECAILNEDIGGLLDKEDILQESFAIEVSSPGLDRPLLTQKDFLRAEGKQVRIFLKEPVNNMTEIEAVARKVQGDFLFLDLPDRIEKIPLNKIKKAIQVIK